MLALPPVAALVVMTWGITGPSYTPDESATLSAVHRTFPQLLTMLGNIDAVHGPYYVVMWVLVRIAGTSELVTRLPSALAMALAATVTAAIGRRIVSPRAGLFAGLALIALPQVSLYAQDARPYAFMTAFATLASYALVRALTAGSGSRVRWLVAYGVFLACVGLSQVFALLLILAHAVTVALYCKRARAALYASAPDPPGAGGTAPGSPVDSAALTAGHGLRPVLAIAKRLQRARRSLVVGWLVAVVAAIVVCSPVVYLGYKQRKSLDTIHHIHPVGALEHLFEPKSELIAFCAIVACGVVIAIIAHSLRIHWPAGLFALSVPWLVVPPAALLIASLATPSFAIRYVLYCLPAAALLCGTALDALGWLLAVAALAVIAIAGLPLQAYVRTEHGRNIRLADHVIAANYRPNDAVLYGDLQTQYQQYAYPYGLIKLKDIQRAQTPAASGTLTGTTVSPQVVDNRLRHVYRIWLYGGGHRAMSLHSHLVTHAGFRLVRSWRIHDVLLKLYIHRPVHRSHLRT